MKRGYADTQLGQVHYVTEGEGEPLLLLHSARRSSRMFWKVMPMLAQDYRVIALDHLGFGNSDALPPRVKIEDRGQNVADFMDALGIKKAHVLGVSTGNKVSTALAAQFPSRVSRVILCGVTGASFHPDQKGRAAALLSGGVRNELTKIDSSSNESELVRDWAAEYSRLTGIWWQLDVSTKKDLSPDIFQGLAQSVLDLVQSRGTMANHVPAILAYDWPSGLRKIKAPTLFIEFASPLADLQYGRQGESLVKLVPNSKLITVEGTTGYGALESRPEYFSQVVLGFLRS